MLLRAVVLIVCATGCPTLPAASELGEPQLLALVADPPCLGPGASSRLATLVAGPSGTLVPTRVAWSVPAGSPGALEGSSVRAAADAIPGAQLEVDVALDADDVTLHGFRTLTIGDCSNPVLAGLTVDGAPAPGTGALAVLPGSKVALDVSVDARPDAHPTVSWFTTAGTIRLYRHTPTELVVRAAPGTGALYVVYRDGNGGVAWLERAVQVTSR